MHEIKPVTIPKEVADAIESFRSDGWSNARIVEAALRGGLSVTSRLDVVRAFAAAQCDTLLAALINGYEREKSPEELAEEKRQVANKRIKIAYDRRLVDATFSGHAHESMRHRAFADGIKFALNELGIVIDGINTKEAR